MGSTWTSSPTKARRELLLLHNVAAIEDDNNGNLRVAGDT